MISVTLAVLHRVASRESKATGNQGRYWGPLLLPTHHRWLAHQHDSHTLSSTSCPARQWAPGTMDMTVTLPPLSEVLRNAGADSMVCEYMQARGLTAVGAFAKVANSIDNLKTTLVQPLLDGYTKGDLHLIIDEADKPIVEAVIITAWEEAQKLWIHHLRLPPWPGATPPAGPAAPAATASLADEKPSRQLPVGVWNSAIQRYNLVEIQGIPRRFPEKELLGAEVTLARMHHEHTKSKMYTPVGLGEIMTHRSFTPTREPGQIQAGDQEHVDHWPGSSWIMGPSWWSMSFVIGSAREPA